MILGIYSIQDVKTAYMGLTVGVSDDDAMRNFSFAVNSNPMWSVNRSDFRLVRLGEWDQETGIIKALSAPKVLLDAASLRGGDVNDHD